MDMNKGMDRQENGKGGNNMEIANNIDDDNINFADDSDNYGVDDDDHEIQQK